MTDLSPEAQAVLDAVADVYWDWCDMATAPSSVIVAAAIRELLEQVLPEHRPHYPPTLDERHRNVSVSVIRDQVFAIVAQLETL